jgi:hypothetical protein
MQCAVVDMHGNHISLSSTLKMRQNKMYTVTLKFSSSPYTGSDQIYHLQPASGGLVAEF